MAALDTFISPEASIEAGAEIGDGCRIWDAAKVRTGAVLGDECIVGRGAFVDRHVRIGARCKIQNNALLYAPATLEDGVFIGPGVILTNDRYPRSVVPDGTLKSAAEWEATGTVVRVGASLGAGAIVVAGVAIGAWSLVGAGTVVTRDVPPHALVLGTPASTVGWVDRHGLRLVDNGTELRSTVSAERYRRTSDGVELIDG